MSGDAVKSFKISLNEPHYRYPQVFASSETIAKWYTQDKKNPEQYCIATNIINSHYTKLKMEFEPITDEKERDIAELHVLSNELCQIFTALKDFDEDQLTEWTIDQLKEMVELGYETIERYDIGEMYDE